MALALVREALGARSSQRRVYVQRLGKPRLVVLSLVQRSVWTPTSDEQGILKYR